MSGQRIVHAQQAAAGAERAAELVQGRPRVVLDAADEGRHDRIGRPVADRQRSRFADEQPTDRTGQAGARPPEHGGREVRREHARGAAVVREVLAGPRPDLHDQPGRARPDLHPAGAVMALERPVQQVIDGRDPRVAPKVGSGVGR